MARRGGRLGRIAVTATVVLTVDEVDRGREDEGDIEGGDGDDRHEVDPPGPDEPGGWAWCS